ncbi:MAG: class I SAM-dependent methyltransferase [Betaproteobacteria bacterium]|nr:class I SAM-dependent methyltransferase [Betaproteobacteria bacterium]
MVACPYCGSDQNTPWGKEAGYTTVKCESCDFLFLNPRPTGKTIDAAVRTGFTHTEAGDLDVSSRRVPRRIGLYRRIISKIFADIFAKGQPVSWLDIGAGYGEIIQAVTMVAPSGSRVVGIEPMHVKAKAAQALGLSVTEGYLRRDHPKVQIASLIDVFSHIPDFDSFLVDVSAVLVDNGVFLLETGNLADLKRREDFFGELGLPDHLAFAGEKHIVGFLDRAGFDVVQIERYRIDGPICSAKNVVKKLLGRNVRVALPFTSEYRTLFIMARKRPTA